VCARARACVCDYRTLSLIGRRRGQNSGGCLLSYVGEYLGCAAFIHLSSPIRRSVSRVSMAAAGRGARPASATPGSDRPLTLLIYTRPASPRRLTRRQAVEVPSWGRGDTPLPPKSWLAPTKFSRSLLLTHSGQLILGKNSKFDATRRQILRQTAGGSLQRSSRPLAVLRERSLFTTSEHNKYIIQVRQW